MAEEYEPQEYHSHGHGSASGGNIIQRIEALPPTGKLALAAAAGGVVVLGAIALRNRTSSKSNQAFVGPNGLVYHLPVNQSQFDENAQPQPQQQQPGPAGPTGPDAHIMVDPPIGTLYHYTFSGTPQSPPWNPQQMYAAPRATVPSSSAPMPAPTGPPPRPASAPAYVAATRTPSITSNTSPAPTTGTGGGYADQGVPAMVGRGAWHGKQQARWNGRGTGAGIGSGPKGGGIGRLGGGPTPAGVHPPTTWPSAGLITTAPGQVAPGMWRQFSVHRGSNH